MIDTVKNIILEKGNVSPENVMVDFLAQKIGNYLQPPIYLLVYKHHEIQFGKIENGHIVLDRLAELTPEYLKELRVFSEQGELHIWKQQQQFKYRLRVDGEGKEVNVYEETHLMWGLEKENDTTIFEPNRGMRLTLPFSVNDAKLPLKYTVRNYFEYDDNGLIRFNDARLVTFLDFNGNSFSMEG